MNIAAEFAATLPEPFTILGLRLLPLSLGRYRLLKRFDSPFVADEEKAITPDILTKELFFALLICGLPVEEFKILLANPEKLAREARRFGKVAGKWISKTERFSIFETFESFKKYLRDGSAMPCHAMPKDGGAAESISHWSHSIEVTLRSKVGWDQHEIDEEPISKALVDFFKLMENEGAVTLMDHDDYTYLMKTGEDNYRILMELQNSRN